MQPQVRQVQAQEGEEWVDIQWYDIKKGQVIRMINPDGTFVTDQYGKQEFATVSASYKSPEFANMWVFDYLTEEDTADAELL